MVVGWSAYLSPLWGDNNGLTNAHCSSVRCASSDAIVTALGGPSVPAVALAARLAARLALRQRAASACCARLHTDHRSRKRLRLLGAAMARISFLASGTLGGIRSGSRSPFYCPRLRLLRRGRPGVRRPGRRGPAGKG